MKDKLVEREHKTDKEVIDAVIEMNSDKTDEKRKEKAWKTYTGNPGKIEKNADKKLIEKFIVNEGEHETFHRIFNDMWKLWIDLTERTDMVDKAFEKVVKLAIQKTRQEYRNCYVSYNRGYNLGYVAGKKECEKENDKLIETIEKKTTRIWQLKKWLEKRDEESDRITEKVKEWLDKHCTHGYANDFCPYCTKKLLKIIGGKETNLKELKQKSDGNVRSHLLKMGKFKPDKIGGEK